MLKGMRSSAHARADTLLMTCVKRIVNGSNLGSNNIPCFSIVPPADPEMWKKGMRLRMSTCIRIPLVACITWMASWLIATHQISAQ